MATAPTELVSDIQYHQSVPLRTPSFPSPVPLMCPPPIPRTRKETPWPSLFPPAPTPQAPLSLPEGLPTPLLPSWKVTTPAPMCSLISRSVSCVTDLLSALSHVPAQQLWVPSTPGTRSPSTSLCSWQPYVASEVSGLPSSTSAVKRSKILAKQELRTCNAQPWVQISDPSTYPRCRVLSKPLPKKSHCLHVGLPCR